MTAFNSNYTPLIYIFLCCINATLLLLILRASHDHPQQSSQYDPPSLGAYSVQPPAGDELYYRAAAAAVTVRKRMIDRKDAAAATVAVSIKQHQVDPKLPSHVMIQPRPCSSFIRKMASSFNMAINLAPLPYPLSKLLHHAGRNDHTVLGGTHEFRPSKFVTTRRSLLNLANAKEAPALISTTKVTISANAATAKTSAHIPVHAEKHLPHHEVDVSATFHVDYSGPKTHPPKNN